MAQRYVLGPGAARKVAELIRGSGKFSRRSSAAPALALASEYPAPYTVQWAQSANEGEGSWIIWLPGDSLLVARGVPVDVRTELEEVGGDYPEGWYLLDMIPGDDDAIIYMSVDIEDVQPYVTFSDEAGGLGDSAVDIVVCEVTLDQQTQERSVRQYVSSVVTLGDVLEPEQNTYGCDERSISLISSTSGDSMQHGRHFHIMGFGKFTVPGAMAPVGTFAPSSVKTLGDSPTDVAFLARVGDSDDPDSNTLAYFRLKGGGGAGLSGCFDIEMRGGVPYLVRCYYNVGGYTRQAADISLEATLLAPTSGSILAFGCVGYNGTWAAHLYSGLSELHDYQQRADSYIVPLYVMAGDGAEILVDLRNAPQIQMVEADLT